MKNKQHFRYIFLILGSISLIIGLIWMPLQFPFEGKDWVSVLLFFTGIYIVFKVLQSSSQRKTRRFSLKIDSDDTVEEDQDSAVS